MKSLQNVFRALSVTKSKAFATTKITAHDEKFHDGEELVESNISLETISFHGDVRNVQCMAYDSAQRMLALGTKDGTIHLFGKHTVEYYFKINWDEENPLLILSEERNIFVDELIFAQNRPYLLALVSKREMKQNFVFVNQFLYVFDLHCRQVRYNLQVNVSSSSPETKQQPIRITALYIPLEGNTAYIGTSIGTIYFFNFVEGLVSSFSIPTISTTTTTSLPSGMTDITCMIGHPQSDRTLLLGYKNGDAKIVEFNGTFQKDIKITTLSLSLPSPTSPTTTTSVRCVCWHPKREECLVTYSNGLIATFSKGKNTTSSLGPIALFESFRGSQITDVFFLNQGTELLINSQKSNQTNTGLAGLFLLKLKDFKTISQTVKLHSNEVSKVLPLIPISQQNWKYLGIISTEKSFYIIDSQNEKNLLSPSLFQIRPNLQDISPIFSLVISENANVIDRSKQIDAKTSTQHEWPLSGGKYSPITSTTYQSNFKSDLLCAAYRDGSIIMYDSSPCTGSLVRVCGLQKDTIRLDKWSKEAFVFSHEDNSISFFQVSNLLLLPLMEKGTQIKYVPQSFQRPTVSTTSPSATNSPLPSVTDLERNIVLLKSIPIFDKLAVACSDLTVDVLDISEGASLLFTIVLPYEVATLISAINFSTLEWKKAIKNVLYIVTTSGKLYLYDLDCGEYLSEFCSKKQKQPTKNIFLVNEKGELSVQIDKTDVPKFLYENQSKTVVCNLNALTSTRKNHHPLLSFFNEKPKKKYIAPVFVKLHLPFGLKYNFPKIELTVFSETNQILFFASIHCTKIILGHSPCTAITSFSTSPDRSPSVVMNNLVQVAFDMDDSSALLQNCTELTLVHDATQRKYKIFTGENLIAMNSYTAAGPFLANDFYHVTAKCISDSQFDLKEKLPRIEMFTNHLITIKELHDRAADMICEWPSEKLDPTKFIIEMQEHRFTMYKCVPEGSLQKYKRKRFVSKILQAQCTEWMNANQVMNVLILLHSDHFVRIYRLPECQLIAKEYCVPFSKQDYPIDFICSGNRIYLLGQYSLTQMIVLQTNQQLEVKDPYLFDTSIVSNRKNSTTATSSFFSFLFKPSQSNGSNAVEDNLITTDPQQSVWYQIKRYPTLRYTSEEVLQTRWISSKYATELETKEEEEIFVPSNATINGANEPSLNAMLKKQAEEAKEFDENALHTMLKRDGLDRYANEVKTKMGENKQKILENIEKLKEVDQKSGALMNAAKQFLETSKKSNPFA